MLEVLSTRFSSADRQAVIEILRETKQTFRRNSIRSKSCARPNFDGRIQRENSMDRVRGENMNKIASFV